MAARRDNVISITLRQVIIIIIFIIIIIIITIRDARRGSNKSRDKDSPSTKSQRLSRRADERG